MNMLVKRNRKENIMKQIRNVLMFLIGIFLISNLTIAYVGERAVVIGSSMETTLYDKDNLLIDKISYRFTSPKRYDIIVFPVSNSGDEIYIKRIIGLPGETIQIKNGYVYINGDRLESDVYGNNKMESPGIAREKIKLDDDEYFCLGDNRNGSIDSRSSIVGPVKRNKIKGRAMIRFYPLLKFKIL